MTFDPQKPCVQRGGISKGEQARILCTDATGPFPIIALVYNSTIEADRVGKYSVGGHCTQNANPRELKHDGDLINIPETRWVNIYSDHLTSIGNVFPSKADADVAAGDDRTACLEFQDGDGL